MKTRIFIGTLALSALMIAPLFIGCSGKVAPDLLEGPAPGEIKALVRSDQAHAWINEHETEEMAAMCLKRINTEYSECWSWRVR